MTTQPKTLSPAAYITAKAVAFGPMGEKATLVTRDTPLPVYSDASPSLLERLTREGDPLPSTSARSEFADFAAPTGAGTGVVNGLNGSIAVGRAYFLQEAIVWSTTPIAGRYQIGDPLSNGITGAGSLLREDIGYFARPEHPARLPLNKFVRSGFRHGVSNYIRAWLDGSVSGTHHVGCGVIGFTLADSLNFGARKVIAFFGDNLWNGTGPSGIDTCIPHRINRYFRSNGVDSRYVLKAYSGSTTEGHENFRKAGRYDFERIDAMFYQVGTNDAQLAASPSTVAGRVHAFAEWKQALYPNAKLVIFGPPPLADNDDEAALNAIRAAVETYVSSLDDGNVFYHNLGVSFDRTNAANYSGGDGVHPDDDGLNAIWDGGYNGYNGLQAWLAANVPGL